MVAIVTRAVENRAWVVDANVVVANDGTAAGLRAVDAIGDAGVAVVDHAIDAGNERKEGGEYKR